MNISHIYASKAGNTIKKWDEVHGTEVDEEVADTVDPTGDVGAGPSISRNYLRGVEDMVEQNDNSFDGVINNAPDASFTRDLVGQAEEDLKNPEKRRSVMERIRNEQERTAVPVTPPSKERARETPGFCPVCEH